MKQFLGFSVTTKKTIPYLSNHFRIWYPITRRINHFIEKLFHKVKTIVSECPELFFPDDTLPVYLETDASDHGHGAYLYQKKDGNSPDRPVAFISKTFTKERLRWSVPP
jgi:hypothetical protein